MTWDDFTRDALTEPQRQTLWKLAERGNVPAGKILDVLDVPPVQGGQGRTADEVECDGKVFGWIAAFAVVFFLIAIL